MKVVITGSSGFIGTILKEFLREKNIEVISLHHNDFEYGNESIIINAVTGADVVVNLAGSPINVRWTKDNKKLIYDSRINLTHKLVKCINMVNDKPSLFISASAIGYYSTEGVNDESSDHDNYSFLSRVAQDWEDQAKQVSPEVRCVILRFGIVLGNEGGLFQMFRKIYSKGIGVIPGSGLQSLSWIHIKDLINVFWLVINDKDISGVVNCVSPIPTDLLHFAAILAKYTKPYVKFNVPAALLHMYLLEGADMILYSPNVVPKVLMSKEFSFMYPDLDSAIGNLVTDDSSKSVKQNS